MSLERPAKVGRSDMAGSDGYGNKGSKKSSSSKKNIKWLTEEEIRKAARKSKMSALECCLAHWTQILDAGIREYVKARQERRVDHTCTYCACCLRYNCVTCPLHDEEGCCGGAWLEFNRSIRNYLTEVSTKKPVADARNAARRMITYIRKAIEKESVEMFNKLLNKRPECGGNKKCVMEHYQSIAPRKRKK